MCMQIKPILRKIRGRLKKNPDLPPDSRRQFAVLPEEGPRVSVEKALNSRCSSDYDDDPSFVHWGMFDGNRKLTDAQIEKIVELCKIPRFTDYKCEIRAEKNILSFIMDSRVQDQEHQLLMIENGMLQQSASLLCAALGIGSLFKSIGPQGKQLNDSELCTINLRLDPMKPSYNGSFWTTSAPQKECAWKSGNLPDPKRDGSVPLISAFENLSTAFKTTDKGITNEIIGQTLWAAKGRTPHLYKSFPWGTTIPTGKIEWSALYVCNNQGLFKYINWEKSRPTHSLQKIDSGNGPLFKRLSDYFQGYSHFILFKNNGSSRVSLWEIGYSLLNSLVQLRALRVSYSVSAITRRNVNEHTAGGLGQVPVILAL